MDSAPALVRVEIKGLIDDPVSRTPIVILRSSEPDEFLPIWIGPFEGQAIAMALEGLSAARPMTHDLLRATIRDLGGSVERVVVTGLRDNTFFSVIEVLAGERTVAIDARPSDALALAVRCGSPIFVHPSVFEAARRAERDQGSEEERLRRWLEELPDEELGKYRM